MSSKVYNVGIIGYGFSTTCFHLPFILPNPSLKLHAFLQRAAAPTGGSTEKGKHCKVDYPDVKHYQKADDFFGDKELDVVIVCSHGDTHADFAQRAMRAGKHVVVEKAFTQTSEEADKIIAVSKETGKILTCYQNRRWDSDFQTMRHLIENDAFGKITEFDNHYDVEFPTWISGWKDPKYTPGNGMTFGLGSHTIDQTLQLFGRPSKITAMLRALRDVDSEVEDSFTVILRYDGQNGNPRANKDLLCLVQTTMVTPMQAPLKCMIRGMNGSYIKFGTDPQEANALAGMSATDAEWGVEDESLWGTLTTFSRPFDANVQSENPQGQVVPPVGPKGEKKFIGRYPSKKGNYMGFYEDLVMAMNGEKKVEVDPMQSRDGIRVIELARQSAEEGRTVDWS